MSAALLVSQALVRSALRHPIRALAAIIGVTSGVLLATLVVALDNSVSAAVDSANITGKIHADIAVISRSSGGFSEQMLQRLTAAAGSARVTQVLIVDPQVIGSSEVLPVIGVEPTISAFLPLSTGNNELQRSAYPGTQELIVGSAWLRAHHHRVGDILQLLGPAGPTRWTIVGTVSGALPNHGMLAAGPLASVGQAFGRPHMADALYVQRTSPDPGLRSRLAAAGTEAVIVGTPAIVSRVSQRSLGIVNAMLAIAAVAGLLGAAVSIFVCWRLVLADERASTARFRLLGATPLDLGAGAGMVLLATTLMCAVVGIPAGIFGERLLGAIASLLVGVTGLTAVPEPPSPIGPALAGFLGAVFIALLAWVASMRAFLQASALQAVRPSDQVFPPRMSYQPVLIVGLAILLTALLFPIGSVPALAVLAIAVGCLGGLAIAAAIPIMLGDLLAARAGRFVRLAAGRQLAADRRRNAAIVILLGLGVSTGLTLEGVALSYSRAIEGSVRQWTHSDLYVRLGHQGQALHGAHFSARLESRLGRLKGVADAGGFNYLILNYHGHSIELQGYDPHHVAGNYGLQVRQGSHGGVLWQDIASGEIAISQSVAKWLSLRPGQTIALPGDSGMQKFRIAAVIDDYFSPEGSILASLKAVARLTGESQLETIELTLRPGVSKSQVVSEIKTLLAKYQSLEVLTSSQFRSRIIGFIAGLLTLFRALGIAALLLVLLASTVTVTASLSVRMRALAIARVVGASRRETWAQLCLEHAGLGIAAWAVGTSLSALLVSHSLQAAVGYTGALVPVMFPAREALLISPLIVILLLIVTLVVARTTIERDLAGMVRAE